MAVISKEEARVAGVLFMIQVRVLADGKFRIKYPDFVAAPTGESEVIADSLKEVKEAFWKGVEEYEKSHKECSRIIVYQIEHTSERVEAGRCRWSRSTKGIMIEVAARVFDMTVLVSGDKKTYGYEEVIGDDQLPGGIGVGLQRPYNGAPDRYLEYTPGRREFFVKLHEAMEELIARVSTISDPDGLAYAIDNGVNLLEAPSDV